MTHWRKPMLENLGAVCRVRSQPSGQHRKQLVQPVGHHLDRQRGQDQTHEAGHDVDACFAQYAGDGGGQ